MARTLSALFLVTVLAGSTGCDALEDAFGDEAEAAGTVEAVDATSITVEATTYAVTAETEYEGYAGIGDVEVGDEVEIEYEDRGGELVALEVEDPANEDED